MSDNSRLINSLKSFIRTSNSDIDVSLQFKYKGVVKKGYATLYSNRDKSDSIFKLNRYMLSCTESFVSDLKPKYPYNDVLLSVEISDKERDRCYECICNPYELSAILSRLDPY